MPTTTRKPKQPKAPWTTMASQQARISRPPAARPAKPPKKRKRIAAKSVIKRRLDREDARLLDQWWSLWQNWTCCVPGCLAKATERHHTRGRHRKLQNIVRWWAPVCHACHARVERDRPWAQSVIVFAGTHREMPLLAGPGQWMEDEP